MNATRQAIHAMDEAQLEQFIDEHQIEGDEYETLEELKEAVCKALGFVEDETEKARTERRRKKRRDAGTELDELALAHQAERGGTYSDALQAVLKAHPDLAKDYAATSFNVETVSTHS